MDTHTTSHTRTRIKGDTVVNNVVNCTLDREGSWTTKSSTAVQCEGAFLNAKNVNSVNEEIPEYTRISDTAEKHMKEVHQEKALTKLSPWQFRAEL